MSNVSGYENYYRTLSKYATYTLGNPGTDIPTTYVGTFDTILIYESQGLPDFSYLGGWHSYYERNNWGVTSYSHLHLSQRYVLNAKQYVGYLYNKQCFTKSLCCFAPVLWYFGVRPRSE